MKRASAIAAFVPAVLLGCSHQGAGSASRVPVTVAHAEQRPVPYEILATGTVEPRQTASDQAQAQNAALDAERYAALVKQDYVTRSDYEARRATAEALQAAVQADSAAVATAQLSLDWTTVRAPISGRTGRLLVREGNLVRASA